MSKLQRYIDRYGPLAGPKVYHAIQSRAAYIGVSNRRRRALSALTGQTSRIRACPKAPATSTAMLPSLAEATEPVASF